MLALNTYRLLPKLHVVWRIILLAVTVTAAPTELRNRHHYNGREEKSELCTFLK
jgi:ribose 1,5-bisphosphokinase PhnN